MPDNLLRKGSDIINSVIPSYIGTPRFCDLVIDWTCVLKCKMCELWKYHSNGLSFNEGKEFIRQLKDFIPAPFEINIMGGEPFLKAWTLDLCNFIAKCGYVSITSTNGYLIDEEMARRITDSGLDSLAISIESLNAETHDFLRGQSGVFKRAMNAIDYIARFKKKRTPYLTVLTIIMEKNLDEILELTEWVNQNEALENISFLALLRPNSELPEKEWYKSSQCSLLWPQNTARLHEIIDELIGLKKKGYKINNPVSQLEAFKEYYIDPEKFMRETTYKVHDYIIDLEHNGDVFLSGEPLFNIRESKSYKLSEAWFSEKASTIRNKIDKYGTGQRVCVINFIVAFPKDTEKEQQVDNCVHHLGLGDFYIEKGDLVKAINEFNRALQFNLKNENAHHGLGRCYKYIREFNKAIDEFKEALKMNPQNEQAHQELGFCYLEQKEIEKAINEFNQVLKLNPRNENSHHDLGRCYKYKREFNKAIDEFKEALEINPQNEQTHQELGFCYLEQRDTDKAISEFNQVLKLNPQNENSHHGLGLCYQRSKQFAKALAEFKQALKINPEDEHVHQSLGFCYKDLREFDKAMKEFKRVLEINPKSEYGYLGLGFCYLEQKDTDNAISEFNQVLKLNPQNEYVHLGLGSCYQYKKQFQKAIDEFRQVLKINPNNEYASPCLASCYEGLRRQGVSIDNIKSIIGIYHKESPIHYSLGLYYLKQDDFSKAISEFNHALEIEPENVNYLSETAVIYFKQKRYKEASKIFYAILKKDPHNQKALKCLKEIEQPDFCVIEVSHTCMFQCKMCNYWELKPDVGEINIQELYKFIYSLKNFVSTPFEMNISGGEPLLKKGMFDLIEFIAKQGFKFSLVTNGYLIDKAIANRIADSGLNFLAISMDTLDECTHDYLRGVKGAYKKAMEALGYFMAYRGKLQNLTLQTIIMQPNLDGILDLAHWVHEKQFSISFMAITQPNMTPLDSNWYRKDEFDFLWPKDASKVQHTIDNLIRLKKSGYRIDNQIGQLERFKRYFSDPERFARETPCSLGDDIIHINPKGDIYLCCQMDSIGNIREGDISEIWISEKAEAIREKIRLCKRNCAGMVNCYRNVV